MFLQNWKNQAREHWAEFQPTRYQELKKAGTLEQALTDAAEQTFRETNELEEAGMQPDEAFQMVRERYLFPKPEPDETDDELPVSGGMIMEMNRIMHEFQRMLHDPYPLEEQLEEQQARQQD